MNDRERALSLLIQRRAFQPGGEDWMALSRAAWKLLQRHMCKPVIRWTEAPPGGFQPH